MAHDLLNKRSGKAAGLMRPQGISMPGSSKKGGSSHLITKRKIRTKRV